MRRWGDALHGPYLLVKADCGQPTGYPVPCYGGNVFTKGDVVLGRERSGPRSVHVLWNIRNTFMKRDSVCGCSCPAPGYYQWNYNLYYARSIDGGVTWRSLDGSHAATVADPAPGAINQPLVWNDAGFLVYEGDVNQTSERSFDVDNDGNPVLVIKALLPGTGSYCPNRQTGHVDNSDSIHPPQYALIARHWNGSSWVGVIPHPFLYIADFPLRYTVKGFSKYFTEGVHCVTSQVRQVPDACVPSSAKHRSRLHYHLAQMQAPSGTWPLMLDQDGYYTEAPGANLLFRWNGSMYRVEDQALPGISMQTVHALIGTLWND